MTHNLYKTTCSLSLALLLALGLFAPVNAAEYWLRAAETSIELPGESSLPMWGYALYPGDFSTTPGPVTIPGPPLVVPPGETLTIHLRNDLPEPTSLVIPGQNSLKPAPVFFPAAPPAPPRVRSFTAEAATGGGEVTYTYPSIAPGSYLYQSGTHPGVQVAMGLYGALSADEATGEAYAGVTYGESLTYLFSEIDIAQHRAVADGTYGTEAYPTTMHAGYQPDYYLLNGRSYTLDSPHEAVTPGSQVLLRLLNAGLRGRVPVVPGMALELLAEDGNPYPSPKMQTSVDLPPGKTLDVRFTAPAVEQTLALFDRRLGLSDFERGSQGMIAFISVGTPSINLHVIPPTDVSNQIDVLGFPGGISCGGLCDQAYLPGTEITLTSSSVTDQALTAWRVYDGDPAVGGNLLDGVCPTVGDCTLTLDADRWVMAEFGTFTNLALLSPAAGEVLAAGTSYLVRWAAPPEAVTFNVAYRLDPGSPWVTIAAGTTANEAPWQVPIGLNLRGNAQLALASFDVDGNFLETVQSSLGVQVRDSVTLQLPNGGETLTIGEPAEDPYQISWSALAARTAVARVGIWYQLSSGTPWQFIATVDGNLSSYSWDLPSVDTAASAVRVGVVLYSAQGEVLVMDASDSTFTILPAVVPPPAVPTSSTGLVGMAAPASVETAPPATPPVLQLEGPTAGEILSVQSGYTVLWQSMAEVDSFSLSYSLDQGENWQLLAKDLQGDQYDWQIDPALQGESQVLLRLEAFDLGGQSMGSSTLEDPFFID